MDQIIICQARRLLATASGPLNTYSTGDSSIPNIRDLEQEEESMKQAYARRRTMYICLCMNIHITRVCMQRM